MKCAGVVGRLDAHAELVSEWGDVIADASQGMRGVEQKKKKVQVWLAG